MTNRIFHFFWNFPVPKVSIDGKSHEDLLLTAVSCGFIIAMIVLIIVTTNLLQLHKKFGWKQKNLSVTPQVELHCASALPEKEITSKSNLLNLFKPSQSFDLSQCKTTTIAASCNDFGAVFKNKTSDEFSYCNKVTLSPAMFDTSIQIDTVEC